MRSNQRGVGAEGRESMQGATLRAVRCCVNPPWMHDPWICELSLRHFAGCCQTAGVHGDGHLVWKSAPEPRLCVASQQLTRVLTIEPNVRRIVD